MEELLSLAREAAPHIETCGVLQREGERRREGKNRGGTERGKGMRRSVVRVIKKASVRRENLSRRKKIRNVYEPIIAAF